MNGRDIIAVALCGFETTDDDDSTGNPEGIIGLTLEKACHEAECLRMALEADGDSLTAGSLWGRLMALGAFLDRHVEMRWRVTERAEKEHGGTA